MREPSLRHRASPMPRGEKLFRFPPDLMLRDFYGTVTIRFQGGKVMHVETKSRWMWRHKYLPEETAAPAGTLRSQRRLE